MEYEVLRLKRAILHSASYTLRRTGRLIFVFSPFGDLRFPHAFPSGKKWKRAFHDWADLAFVRSFQSCECNFPSFEKEALLFPPCGNAFFFNKGGNAFSFPFLMGWLLRSVSESDPLSPSGKLSLFLNQFPDYSIILPGRPTNPLLYPAPRGFPPIGDLPALIGAVLQCQNLPRPHAQTSFLLSFFLYACGNFLIVQLSFCLTLFPLFGCTLSFCSPP